MVTSSDPAPFRHPALPRERRHGANGYADYASYRPWLRDEFSYRCVYCLVREQWGRVSGEFDLDHFVPQAANPSLATEYDNLVYSCHSCNLRKANDTVPDLVALMTHLWALAQGWGAGIPTRRFNSVEWTTRFRSVDMSTASQKNGPANGAKSVRSVFVSYPARTDTSVIRRVMEGKASAFCQTKLPCRVKISGRR